MTANDQTSGSFKDKEKFLSALKAGDVEYLKAAISQGLKPRKIEPSAMLLLASLGEEQCMRLLLEDWGNDSHCGAIEAAARMGHAGCVAALLPHCDPKESRALRFAAQAGEVECVRLLASVGNVSEQPTPLFMAAHGGYAECAALLIPVSDLSAKDVDGFTASRQARDRGHVHVAEMIDSAIEAQLLESSIPAKAKLAQRRIDRVGEAPASGSRPGAI